MFTTKVWYIELAKGTTSKIIRLLIMGTKMIVLDTISSLYKAMNVIEMKTRGENDHVPEDFKGQFDLYRVMKSLDVRNKKFLSYFQDDFFKIANSRNPFTRLYSAWNDKSRTHRRQDGSGLVLHDWAC